MSVNCKVVNTPGVTIGDGTGIVTTFVTSNGQTVSLDNFMPKTGDSEINGNVTATSFIKKDGTSSQFLKADGSSDSSEYVSVAGGSSSLGLKSDNLKYMNADGSDSSYTFINFYSAENAGGYASDSFTSLKDMTELKLNTSTYVNGGNGTNIISVLSSLNSSYDLFVQSAYEPNQYAKFKITNVVNNTTYFTLTINVYESNGATSMGTGSQMYCRFVKNSTAFVPKGTDANAYLMADGSTLKQSAAAGNSNYYVFKTGGTGTSPASGYITWGNYQYLATKVYLSKTTTDGFDITPFVKDLSQLNDLYLQKKSSAGTYIRYNITEVKSDVDKLEFTVVSPPVENSSNFTSSANGFAEEDQLLVSFFSNLVEADTRLSSLESVVAVSGGTKTVTATSFVKSGGSASEFLKADGSTDSNSYLPLAGGTMTGPLTGVLNSNSNVSLTTGQFLQNNISPISHNFATIHFNPPSGTYISTNQWFIHAGLSNAGNGPTTVAQVNTTIYNRIPKTRITPSNILSYYSSDLFVLIIGFILDIINYISEWGFLIL